MVVRSWLFSGDDGIGEAVMTDQYTVKRAAQGKRRAEVIRNALAYITDHPGCRATEIQAGILISEAVWKRVCGKIARHPWVIWASVIPPGGGGQWRIYTIRDPSALYECVALGWGYCASERMLT